MKDGIAMKQKRKWSTVVLCILVGFIWAYSFSSRVGLFFLVPFWLKFILLFGLGINAGLLILAIWPSFSAWIKQLQSRRWLLLSGFALTVLIFALGPYRTVPFPTTHSLTLTALDQEVKLVAVYSPDDNLIGREAFQTSPGVTEFDAVGFRLPAGSGLFYQRSQTGGLTLSFTRDSGIVSLQWDRIQTIIDLETIQNSAWQPVENWRASVDEDTGRSLLIIPGDTWGSPSTLWTILAVLLPVADFISLTSLWLLLTWLALGRRGERLNRRPIKIWMDASLSVALAMLLIEIGFPYFVPGWFTLFFVPAMIYLAYGQLKILNEQEGMPLPWFVRLQSQLQSIHAFLKSLNRNPRLLWILITIVAVAGVIIQLHLTAPGMGISGDSVHYMEGARHLAAGDGYVRQIAEGDPVIMTGFPPVYSWSLVPSFWFNINVEHYARYMNALLLAACVALIGLIVFKTTDSALPAFWVTAFFILSPLNLNIYSWMMSEPLFLALLLGAILVWFRQLQQPAFWRVLITGLLVGLLINTRLAGIAFLPVFMLGILFFQTSPFRIKLRDALLLGLTAIIQPAAFFIRNSLVARGVSESRGLGLATFTKAYWQIIGAEISSWFKWQAYFNFAYQRFNALFITLGVLLCLTIAWLIFRKRLNQHKGSDSIIHFMLIAIPVYLAVIVLNTVLFTPGQTQYGLTRYMIPLLMMVLILIGKLGHRYWNQSFLFPRIMILFIVLVGMQLYIADVSENYWEPQFGFREYTDRKNQCQADVLAIVEQFPDQSFYTNNCEYFYYLTGRTCRHLTLTADAYTKDGEIYQAVEQGSLIAYASGFGTTPPGIWRLTKDLTVLGQGCYLRFYQWPEPQTP